MSKILWGILVVGMMLVFMGSACIKKPASEVVLPVNPAVSTAPANQTPAPPIVNYTGNKPQTKNDFLFPIVMQFKANNRVYFVKMTGIVNGKDAQGNPQLFLRGKISNDLVQVDPQAGMIYSIPWETLCVQNTLKKVEGQPLIPAPVPTPATTP